ncbi:hypothetical protein GE061_005803 [Apolygus lucorum]|uniref:MADF domain-containing protein n=1 Tax=Apolygus lucorum TaxID=248454 RepID=A0A8S9X1A5_APOLU|nr:hypothetical protein GE061_005803 [Apolygus lucorum]
MEFLKMYKREPVLWDPKHANYKDRKHAYAAWDRLAELTNLSVRELKRKKDSLMATFRTHLRKKRASRSKGDEVLYKSIWFAYDFMEDFLSDVYGEQRERRLSEDSNHDDEYIDTKITLIPVSEPKKIKLSASGSGTETPTDTRPTPRHRRDPSKSGEDSLNKPSSSVRELKRDHDEEEDECDLYGRILAKKLRRLPELDRAVLMHDIDGMMINVLRSYLDSSQWG